MPHQKWDENKIEDLVRKLPTIKDDRTKEVVYNRVQVQLEGKRKSTWVFPSIASALAASLLLIIGLSFYDFTNKDSNSSFQIASSPSQENRSNKEMQSDTSVMENAEQDSSIQEKIEKVHTNSIYKEEIGEKEVLTYPIPDDNVQVLVPVSIMVNNPEHLSRFELYKQYIRDVINQTKWQLSDYLPLDPKMFTYNQEQATVNVNFEEGVIQLGSHSEGFFRTLIDQQLETIGAKKMAFYSNGKEGVVFGNREETEINYQPLVNRAYFLLDDTDSEQEVLYVPWEEPFDSIKAALNAMKQDVEKYGLLASIPKNINFEEITENISENQLILYLTDESIVEDNKETIEAIECILLTAKEFNYQSVKFENTEKKYVGEFNLSNELEVPVAANNVDL